MRLTLIALALVLLARTTSAEPVVQLRNNGPIDNRLNVVVLGDGYTPAELLKYSTDVDLFMGAMFRQSPYSDYERYFNVFRIDVASNESGADHPERGVYRDTALGATYNCGGIQRTICVNNAAVNAVVNRSLPANSRDLLIVIVNDAEYGGSGGSVLVGSTHVQAVEILLHESGHTLGLLADEYTTQPPPCFNGAEPSEANATRASTRESAKWGIWIGASTPVPSSAPASNLPSLYPGARYCDSGLYRPTYNSKMRSLFLPFESINQEQLILRIYNFVSPLDSVTPSDSELTLTPGDRLQLVADTPQAAVPLTVRWLVDDTEIATGRTLILTTRAAAVGRHRLRVEVSDRTSAVRRDNAGVLVAHHDWELIVNSFWGRTP